MKLSNKWQTFKMHLHNLTQWKNYSWGYEQYPDKPKFGFYTTYFNGWHYVFHCGKLWIANVHL